MARITDTFVHLAFHYLQTFKENPFFSNSESLRSFKTLGLRCRI